MKTTRLLLSLLMLIYAVLSGAAPKQPQALKAIEAGVQKKWLQIKDKWADAKKHEVESRAEFAKRKKRAMARNCAKTRKRPQQGPRN